MSKAAELAKFIADGTLGADVTAIKHSGGTSALTIDSSGRTLFPSRPAFSATRDAGDVAVGSVVIFDDVRTNIGNHYDASNGRFTAPIAGTYAFFVYGMSGNAPNDVNMALKFQKNGSDNGDSTPLGRGSSDISLGIQVGGQIIITLAASDYVDVLQNGGTGITMYATGNAHNEFSGFLIG